MKKPRLRYGVGTLLILMTSVCVGLVVAVTWSESAGVLVETIQGPLTSGSPPQKLDPPTDHEVLEALRKALAKRRGFVTATFPEDFTNIRIVRQKTNQYVEPAKVYPVFGAAQQHHTHYRYTIYYDLKRGGRYLSDKDRRYVLDVDYHHLHVLPSQSNQVAGTSLHLPQS